MSDDHHRWRGRGTWEEHGISVLEQLYEARQKLEHMRTELELIRRKVEPVAERWSQYERDLGEVSKKLSDVITDHERAKWLRGLIVQGTTMTVGAVGTIWLARDVIAKVWGVLWQ
jgi:hypothetical protein